MDENYLDRMPHDPEIHTCPECGGQFDLARQSYYSQYCPQCEAKR